MRSCILERNPALCPVANFIKCILELTSLLGELILDPDRRLRNYRANDEVFSFERAKSLRQHAVGDVRNGSLDQGITSPARQQGAQDGPRPTAADELDSPVEARTDLRNWLLGTVSHGIEVTIDRP